ncbi:MAG: RNA polymerase sigma factor [Chitinophagaceae bacterium]|nr:RNA polymerase sigma factor [Chitinophagaceae bacterium]
MSLFYIDKEGFDLYYNQYSQRIYAFLRRLGAGSQDAEDLLQETFIKLWANRRQIESTEHVKNWLYMVAWRTAIDFRKAKKTNDQWMEYLDQLKDVDYFEMECISSEWLNWIYTQLDNLPPGESSVLKGLFVDGLTMQEIARIRGSAIKTVYNQRNDGLIKLRARLGKEQYTKIAFIFLIIEIFENGQTNL